MFELLAAFLLFNGPVHYDHGRLSMYRPGDGNHAGKLACGGAYTEDQVHIAYRRWWKVGCGRKVFVCAEATGRCAKATVQDAGPYGAYKGKLEGGAKMRREGRYRVASRAERRSGILRPLWKWRSGPGGPDLSYSLWKKLGRPRFLSNVHLFFMPRSKSWRESPGSQEKPYSPPATSKLVR